MTLQPGDRVRMTSEHAAVRSASARAQGLADPDRRGAENPTPVTLGLCDLGREPTCGSRADLRAGENRMSSVMLVIRFLRSCRTASPVGREKEKQSWKTTSCTGRRTKIRNCAAARPAAPCLAWLIASSTLELARRFACIGANAARAYGSIGPPHQVNGSIYGNSVMAPQDHAHGT